MMGDQTEREIEKLREENAELRRKLNDVEARCEGVSRRFTTLVEVMLGDPDELGAYEPEEMRAVLQRLVDLEEKVAEHDTQVAMVRSDGGGADTPDGRARRIRKVLYKNAKKNNGRSSLDRDAVNGILGGGHHRATVLDAMKRAADGSEADINGSSKIQPLNGITMRNGSVGREQAKIEMDLTKISSSDVRKNLTTMHEGMDR